jgi:hypothetical protein
LGGWCLLNPDEYSDYLVFVDESGDHGLDRVDSGYPVFVLAFVIVAKEDYVSVITPDLQRLKLKYFGHDNIIFHERDIRRGYGPFKGLNTKERKLAFLEDLNEVMKRSPITVVASVIDKNALKEKYIDPANPYDLALGFGLERITRHLEDLGQAATTFVTMERRGRREDDQLELEFRRVRDGRNILDERLPLEPVFASKHANLAGLQLADLVARPIGLHRLRPDQENRAYEIVATKLRRRPHDGKVEGWGVKHFP